jgi:parallel beta-helix repeat protein
LAATRKDWFGDAATELTYTTQTSHLVRFLIANTPPTVASAIPDTTVIEDSAPIDNYRDLNDVFTDIEDGSALTFVIESNSNPGLVNVAIDADSALDLSFTANESGSATIVAKATDSGALSVEDTLIVTVTPTYDISGRVFEDAVITAGVGEPFNGGEGDTGLSGARVELFDASDVFQSFTTTDGSGDYAFANLDGGATYKIRVVTASLDAGVGALPEQTFESDGSTDYGTFGTAMGGQDALAADTTGQSTMTGAEHWVSVSIGAADITGVDFGFSYELVVNTNDTAQGSFRRFLDNANAIAGVQTTRFNIPTTDPNYTASPLAYVIQPLSTLPEITDPTIIDGTTQPDFAATPIVVLDGTQAGAGVSGLWISGGGSTVRGLVVHQFTLNGIHVTGTGGNTIEGTYIGIDVTGLLDRGNGAHGIHIDSDTGANTIGGLIVAQRNVISGNGANGIFLQASSTNIVRGNYIGTDKNGAPNLGNGGHGILIDAGDDNAIGGTAVGEANLISGNGGSGVAVTG